MLSGVVGLCQYNEEKKDTSNRQLPYRCKTRKSLGGKEALTPFFIQGIPSIPINGRSPLLPGSGMVPHSVEFSSLKFLLLPNKVDFQTPSWRYHPKFNRTSSVSLGVESLTNTNQPNWTRRKRMIARAQYSPILGWVGGRR